MIRVSARARRHEDRAGAPLDGRVNMFDVGIVLAVAFLLAALSSLHLTHSLVTSGLHPPKNAITVPSGGVVRVTAEHWYLCVVAGWSRRAQGLRRRFA